MSFLYVLPRGNAFNRGTSSVSPAESAVAPKANLYDNDPSTPHIAGSVAADSYMRVGTLNILTNPGFETSTLSGWTDNDQGTGASTETTTAGEFRSGAKGLHINSSGPSDYGSRYQDFAVSAGESRRASVWMRASNFTGAIFLKNLKTGNYYNGSAWASTRAAAVSLLATTTFGQASVDYTVETFDACRADTVTLRWELSVPVAGVVTFDDCLDLPGVNFASIHGHNYGPVIPLVQSSDDGAAWTTRATMTIKRPAFYSTFSTVYAEYWQIKLSGTPIEAPYTGEAVLGAYQTSATAPQWGIPTTRNFPGVRMRGPSGRPHVYNYCTDPPQDITCEFSARTAAASRELAESIWLRSGQGLYPVIFVPIDTETDVFYGRLMDPVTVERPFSGVYETKLTLVGDPLPTVGL